MNETKVMLQKIASLRDGGEERFQQLERQVTTGLWGNIVLDSTLRQLGDPSVAAAQMPLPAQLTASARRLLELGRELLTRLRTLGAALKSQGDELDPLQHYYRDTVAMADTALRMVQAFPDAPSGQLQLCQGLEVILIVVGERTVQLGALIERRRCEQGRVDILADTLLGLAAGRSVNVNPLIQLAENILAEAGEGGALRFFETAITDRATLARHLAGHGLNVAQVAARLVRHNAELCERSLDLVLAALLHDAGMLLVPVDTLAHPEPLDNQQRRDVEAHALLGADMVLGLFPNADWLRDALTSHHERLDGTGYPAGLRELQIAPLVRLLTVCDVYAALCTARPHRPARDTRDALADTLLLAEQGLLDRADAERLMMLSFYPVGCLVELADGSIGTVVATHMGRRDLNTPGCPVVALLTDAERRPLSTPRHLDLSECAGQSIVRSLSPSEGRELLGKRRPELAA